MTLSTPPTRSRFKSMILNSFLLSQRQYVRHAVNDLDASGWRHSRESARNQKKRDNLSIQFQQVTETVAKNVWLTGSEKIRGRERLCGVAKGISVLRLAPLKRYTLEYKVKFWRLSCAEKGLQKQRGGGGRPGIQPSLGSNLTHGRQHALWRKTS